MDNSNSIENDHNLSDSVSTFGSTFGPALSPLALNIDVFNSSQDSQRKDELIMESQIQKNKQEKPTAATDQEKSDMQQSLINLADQATLTEPSRQNLRSWDDVEGRNGISIHGPCCHGPRVLLTFMGRAQETGPKVT